MNLQAIAYYLGRVLRLVSAFMLLPLSISLFDRDFPAVRGFAVSIVIALILSLGLDAALRMEEKRRGRERNVYVKDGFIVVAVCWLCISVFGALPYYLSGEIPSFIDCLFESVSGFTTTGSSILTNVEALSRGLLFWRSFTIWIGGMGVLVFLLAASRSEHSVFVMKAESSGPTPGKLVPRLRQSSLILYGIYFTLTVVQIVLLAAGGMPLYDSACCAMSTAGTGGFFIKNASMAHYGNVYIEVVTTFFMVLFGINFNMLYFLLIRNFKAVWRSEEFRVYMGIFFGATALITTNLFAGNVYGLGASLRHASFQVGSMMTTTGFSTQNFDLWPQFSRVLLMVIMMIGASAGSTGGGLKVSRLVILLKETKRLVFRMSHPRAVGIVKLDGRAVDKQVVHYVNSFFITFTLLTVSAILIVSLDNFDFESTVTAVLACIGNAGPGLGMVSPIGNYAAFSVLSKLVLSLGMLVGRLEIYPILLLMTPRTWRRV